MALPARYEGDWSRMAKVIVHQSLKTQPRERVLIYADPTYFPELTEQVRIEVVRAGAVEVSTTLMNSPSLDNVRRQFRRREDPQLKRMEDESFAKLFEASDIFIWLPNDWAHNLFQTEDIIRRWPGRGIHFHWIPGWWPTYGNDPALFRTLSRMYEDALYIDYRALAERQQRLVDILRDSAVHVTTPLGTDLTFELKNAHFHQNNGDASMEYVSAHARAGSARDREEELPAGVIRTVDVSRARGRLIVPNETYPAWVGRRVGNLSFQFEDDRIVEIHGQHHDDYVQAMWSLETGTKDRIGEFIIGTNPALTLLPGHEHDGILPYFGFGAGVVRISMGNNLESAGTNDTSFLHNWLFLTDATVEANGTVLIKDGKLVVGAREPAARR